MILSELLVALSGIAWLAVLFAVALYGERRPGLLARHWRFVYALSLGVHCTSWTFYGTVTQAERSGWWLPPTFLGVIALYVLAAHMLMQLVELARECRAGSLADLVAARLGHHAGLAALVTAITALGIVPYIALQLKAVAMSHALVGRGKELVLPPWQDGALYVALAMAAFAMLFGTRRAPVAAHNRGLVLALAFESLFKLGAMLAIGLLVLRAPDLHAALEASPRDSRGFPPLILLGALAAFTLPHQFHAGVVECRDAAHVRTARWVFPLYLVLIALPILPLAEAGASRLAALGIPSDLYVLALPLAQGQHGLAVLGFLGGLSAATSMVIVATLALSLMIGNHWIAPLRVRTGWGRGDAGDLRPAILRQRRAVILAVVLLAWLYSRALGMSEALADLGALSFSALAGLMPAVLAAMYRPGLGARAVATGLAAGTLAWAWVLLPRWMPGAAEWLHGAPLGLGILSPAGFLGLGEWSALARAVTASLAVNIAVLLLVARSRWAHPSLHLQPGRIRHAELASLAGRFLATERVEALFAGHEGSEWADPDFLAAIERELAGVIGAASARLLLEVAQRERGGELATVAAIVDEASQDLRFNQRVLEAALENMSQGICVVDAELRVVAWNRRYAELFDYPPGLLAIGRPVAELTRHNITRGLIGEGDVEGRVERRMEHMRRGTPHLAERRIAASMVEIRGTPMPGGGYVATFTDVSAFREAERALSRANETLELRVRERTAALSEASAAAERANRDKTRFLHAVSHDLAQPLHAARLFAQALAERLQARPEAATLAHIDGALGAAGELLESLLDIARLERGNVPVSVRPCNTGELLEGLAAEFGVLAAARGLELRHVGTHARIVTDPHLLRRVLQNFLANALRYTRHGRILLGCRRRAGKLRIEVWDTGPGIAEEQQALIFEEFRRLERDGEGLGLGLAIAERIAHLLGHALTLRSWPGRGSVFAIEVPLAGTAVPPAAPAASPAPAAAGHALIVDNDPAALAALRELLEGWNWRASPASDPDGALAACAPSLPDLLILDYHLDGGMTGLALRERLPQAVLKRPAILLTADHGEAIRREAEAAGCHLLHKPLRPLALKTLLARLVAGRGG